MHSYDELTTYAIEYEASHAANDVCLISMTCGDIWATYGQIWARNGRDMGEKRTRRGRETGEIWASIGEICGWTYTEIWVAGMCETCSAAAAEKVLEKLTLPTSAESEASAYMGREIRRDVGHMQL